MFVDTHCHISMMVLNLKNQELQDCDIDVAKVLIKQVNESGVGTVISIGANVLESKNALTLAKHCKDIFATIGIHPCDCEKTWKDELLSFEPLLQQKKEHKIVALGETGLDFFHKPFDKERQIAAFKQHIECALTYDLPIVIHSRDSHDETLQVLQAYVKNGLRGVLHCFSHPAYVAEQVLAWGFFIGIGAYITYPKNNELRETVKNIIPVDRILLETDAPFLPPQSLRGKQNSPAYIPLFAPLIADLKQISLNDLEAITTRNARSLFEIY